MENNLYSIYKTIKHLELKNNVVPLDVKIAAHRAMKAATDYAGIRATFWASVYDAVFDFLNGKAQVSTYSRQMDTATSKAYIESADMAFVDGGGTLPLDEDTAAFARGELDAQFGYIDSLFQTLKELRKEGGFDAISEAFRTASRWASALDGFYNNVKLKGAGNIMLTWQLGNTEKHCDTCLSLDGKRHHATWFSSRGYIPKKPGSNTDCGGYNCDCALLDEQGNEFSIGNGFSI